MIRSIGYLHLDPPEGVTGDGYRLASFIKKRWASVEVIEERVMLTDQPIHNEAALRAAAASLSRAEVVCLQFSENNWGGAQACLFHLGAFIRNCTAPISVAINDTALPIFAPRTPRAWFRSRWRAWKVEAQAKGRCPSFFPTNGEIRRWLFAHCDWVHTGTLEEKRRLQALDSSRHIEQICCPSVIDSSSLPSRKEARALLQIPEQTFVLAELGYIYSGKGYHLLVEAVAKLPSSVFLLLAGGPTPDPESQRYAREVESLIEQYGLKERSRITGYLSEAELRAAIAAADLGIVPYEEVASSGGILMWVSAGRPVLASDHPTFREYEAKGEVKGQGQGEGRKEITFFQPYTAQALADAIEFRMGDVRGEALSEPAFTDLTMEAIVQRHLDCYATLVRNRNR